MTAQPSLLRTLWYRIMGEAPSQQAPVEKSAKAAFNDEVLSLMQKTDMCKMRLQELGLVRLEESFVHEMMIGLMPDPTAEFCGNIKGSFLKRGDGPPRDIVFVGLIASQEGGYFTAGFFHDDGTTMHIKGFVPIDTLFDYFADNAPARIEGATLDKVVNDLFASPVFAKPSESGLLGRKSKWLDNNHFTRFNRD
jgi:hypothetical protein